MPSCPNSWDATHWVPISSCRSPCHDSVSLPRRESRGQKEGGYDLHKVERSPGRGPPGWDSSCAREKRRPGGPPGLPRAGALEPRVPPLARAPWGRGVGRNHTGLKFPLLARRGRRRGGPRGEGRRVGGRTESSGPGLQSGGWGAAALPVLSAQARPRHPALSDGPGAGRSPPLFPEVAGIVTPEVSAQAQPPQPPRGATALSSPGSDPATGACGVGREAGARGPGTSWGCGGGGPETQQLPTHPQRPRASPAAPLRSGHPGIHLGEEDSDGSLSTRGPSG